MKKNPFIEPSNYFDGYKESLEHFLNSHDKVQLDKLIYNVLAVSEDGKKLMEIFKDRFICMPTPGKLNEFYDKTAIYYEGFRCAFRFILAQVEIYQNRKAHEAKQAEHK